MKVAYVTNAPVKSGVGYRAYHLERAFAPDGQITLEHLAFRADALPFTPWPGMLGSKSVNWVRWGRKLDFHPFHIVHATNQTLSFIVKHAVGPSVVTVHDIVEVLEPQAPKAALLNRYLYSGITGATHLIAVSEHTKKTVCDYFNIPSRIITVIPNGVGNEFYPIPDFENSIGFQELRRDLKLQDRHPIVLYVGSDHPRKNLSVALEAFAKLRDERSDAIFLKVGDPGLLSGRAQTLVDIDRLDIRDSVHFVHSDTDENLNLLYNLADVLIYPSRFEGFGLPPLQAMAAGLPVVTSNATSLPEVVGDAALTHNPDDVDAFVHSLKKLTSDRTAAAEYRRRGINRAKTFSWKKAAGELAGVYEKITT